MCWSLRLVFWCRLTIPSVVWIAGILPSYATSNTVNATQSNFGALDTADKVAQTLPAPTVNPKPDPNRDRFPQPLPTPTPLPEQEPILAPPTPESQPAQSNVRVFIRKVLVVGSTVFGAKEINPIVRPLEGRSVTLNELQKAADAIT